MPEPRPPLTDSPWFWVYLFATFGVIVLAVAGPKYRARQWQIEHKDLARQRSWEVRTGQEPTTELPEVGEVSFSLWPLISLLSVLLACGWSLLWWQRLRPRRSTAEDAPSAPSQPASPRSPPSTA